MTEERVAFSRLKSEVLMNEGSAAGITAHMMIEGLLAPMADRASCGPRSTSSMASAKKRPQNPILSTMSASVPANGPSPTDTTKSSAHTRSGTVRKNAMSVRAAWYTAGWGERCGVASTAMGTLSSTPTTVPTSAIWKVSSRARPTASSRAVEGGSISPTRRPIWGKPSKKSVSETPVPCRDHTKNAPATAQATKVPALMRSKRCGGACVGMGGRGVIEASEDERIGLVGRGVLDDATAVESNHAVCVAQRVAQVV
ncbi:hypothetical protein FQZ97_720550 [compost metagenome]